MRTSPKRAPRDVSAPAGLSWRRMHPITPLVKGWQIVVALMGALAIQQGPNIYAALIRLAWPPVAAIAAVVAGMLVISALIMVAVWMRTEFAISADTVYLRKGVIARSQRSAKLDRIQAIDVVQPLLGRLFGLAELKIDVAGGLGSGVSLAYLREDDARALRVQLLTVSAGLKAQRQGDLADSQSAASGPDVLSAQALPRISERLEFDRPIFAVPTGLLLRSLLRSVWVWVSVIPVVVMIGFLVAGHPQVLTGFLPLTIGLVGVTWARFSAGFNFEGGISPEGIRLRHGLVENRHQTVPPGRIQAVELRQGLLWRGPNWWRVTMNVAGYVGEDANKTDTLLPVGDKDTLLRALWLALPDLGTPDPLGLLEAAMRGRGTDHGFRLISPRARLLDPFTWRRTGFVQTERAVIIRSGWLWRRVTVVPHAKTQSLAVEQGPVERFLGVATFRLHSTIGGVAPVIKHLDLATADELMTSQSALARAARASAGPEQWFAHVVAEMAPVSAEMAPVSAEMAPVSAEMAPVSAETTPALAEPPPAERLRGGPGHE